MKAIKQLTILVGTSFLMGSCMNSATEKSFGECVDSKINGFKGSDVKNPPASIYQYTYKGEKVYYIPPYCCDNMGVVLNEKCDVVCNPDGGITGQGDGQCIDFFAERKDEKLLWKDDRNPNSQ